MTEKQLLAHFDQRFKEFTGDITLLERAIGCYIITRKLGWKVSLLVHDRKTIRQYEELLGLDFKEQLPEVGDYAKKSRAWNLVQQVSSFWKAAKGEIPGIRTTQVD